MKKLFFSMMALSAVMLAACDKTEDPRISLNPASISAVSAEGAEKTITVNSPVDWTLAEDCEWLSADVTEGKANEEVTVKLTIDANDGDARNADVTVSGTGAAPVKINVAQDAAPEEEEEEPAE